MSQTQNLPVGPPYLPKAAQVGGLPTVSVDVPALSVLMAVYVAFAITNMTIFQLNRRRGHLFRQSLFLFGFCMARIATCVLRIVWATRQTNVRLAIAAGIFINAGILILYILNLLFAHRILRAKKPQLSWLRALDRAIKALYVLIVLSLIMVITATILSFYTLNMNTRMVARDIQRAAITYLLFISALPLFLLAFAFLPQQGQFETTFGERSTQTKAIVITLSSTLCVLIAGFKAGTAWEKPRPINQPAWFDSKGAFYVFNFALEIIALSILTLSRVDKLFYVPKASETTTECSREEDMSQEDHGSIRESAEVKLTTDF